MSQISAISQTSPLEETAKNIKITPEVYLKQLQPHHTISIAELSLFTNQRQATFSNVTVGMEFEIIIRTIAKLIFEETNEKNCF